MFGAGCDPGALYLTDEFLARDEILGQYPENVDESSSKKRQLFLPIEDLVALLDTIASSAVPT